MKSPCLKCEKLEEDKKNETCYYCPQKEEYLLKAHGFRPYKKQKIFTARGSVSENNREKLKEIPRDVLLAQYEELGTVAKVARYYKVHRSAMSEALKTYGIEIKRTKKDYVMLFDREHWVREREAGKTIMQLAKKHGVHNTIISDILKSHKLLKERKNEKSIS